MSLPKFCSLLNTAAKGIHIVLWCSNHTWLSIGRDRSADVHFCTDQNPVACDSSQVIRPEGEACGPPGTLGRATHLSKRPATLVVVSRGEPREEAAMARIRTSLLTAASFAVLSLAMPTTGANAAEASTLLAGFAILASSTVTNTGATTVYGDIGVSPGSALTGFGTLTQTGGAQYVATDTQAVQAQSDLI